MNNQELLRNFINTYRQNFDMMENFRIEDTYYDAYGFCNITNSKYVLVKKAELWRALCYEHVFFKTVDFLEPENVSAFQSQLKSYIEPKLVRNGEKTMPKDHMYSYITCVFLCENGLSPDTVKSIRKAKFFKDYMLSIRGYCELRLVAVDLENRKVVGNPAARDLIKDYKKLLGFL